VQDLRTADRDFSRFPALRVRNPAVDPKRSMIGTRSRAQFSVQLRPTARIADGS
jgi:hypothetical protein